ncbi:hypothetical protein BpHYR1_033194 [Brachionus plicatilis]|uniref:Uncharacterized protein n=1 Tax=Brachionus plicatilis TaxID=10195 RepID=A0A3M7QNB8_BRAPC|nr:hypothetical protein BpHYR1_033194 [Brachionus plicatilis]
MSSMLEYNGFLFFRISLKFDEIQHEIDFYFFGYILLKSAINSTRYSNRYSKWFILILSQDILYQDDYFQKFHRFLKISNLKNFNSSSLIRCNYLILASKFGSVNSDIFSHVFAIELS